MTAAPLTWQQRCNEAMPGCQTWGAIAAELGYSTAHYGRTALEMARRYASGAGFPWPSGQAHRGGGRAGSRIPAPCRP